MLDDIVYDVIAAVVVFGGGVLGLTFILYGYLIYKGDDTAWKRNSAITKSVSRAYRGEVPTIIEGKRSYQVNAGLVRRMKDGTLKSQGRLSPEAISETLGP